MGEFVNSVDVVGDNAVTDSIIARSITEYNDDTITSIGAHAFRDCTMLTSVHVPSVEKIASNAFYGCTALSSVNFHSVQVIDSGALTSCTALTTVDLPSAVIIGSSAFRHNNLLATLILRTSVTVCSLNSQGIGGTAIANGNGYIYVPSAMVDMYKAASNWSTYASQFRVLEDYTVDGTTTGDLDPSKI